MWGLGRRAGSRGDKSLNWKKKKRILSGCRVRGKKAARHSPVLLFLSASAGVFSSFFLIFRFQPQ